MLYHYAEGRPEQKVALAQTNTTNVKTNVTHVQVERLTDGEIELLIKLLEKAGNRQQRSEPCRSEVADASSERSAGVS